MDSFPPFRVVVVAVRLVVAEEEVGILRILLRATEVGGEEGVGRLGWWRKVCVWGGEAKPSS